MAGLLFRYAAVIAAVLAGGSGLALAWTPQPQDRPAAETPGARNGHRMANASVRGEAVLFGGVGPGAEIMGDTWIFRNGKWLLAATHGPAPRAWHSMTYLPRERLTILFGGRGADGRSLADTWAWDGTRWRELKVEGPPARDHHAQALDPALGGLLLFGGFNGTSIFGDTWLFREGRWQRLESKGPPPRAAHAMSADATGVLLFGGLELPNRILGDTWRWQSGRWKRIEARARERSHLAMHFDPGCRCVVRFGGKDQHRIPHAESWLFLNEKWVEHPSAPSARIDFALETLGSKLILFGGKTPDPGVQMSDTWVFRDSRWMKVPLN